MFRIIVLRLVFGLKDRLVLYICCRSLMGRLFVFMCYYANNTSYYSGLPVWPGFYCMDWVHGVADIHSSGCRFCLMLGLPVAGSAIYCIPC